MIAEFVSHDAFVFTWVFSAFATATLAMAKSRNALLWLFGAFLTGPLALLTLLPLRHSAYDPAASMEPESMDLCRECFEPVRRDSETCRYCGVTMPVPR